MIGDDFENDVLADKLTRGSRGSTHGGTGIGPGGGFSGSFGGGGSGFLGGGGNGFGGDMMGVQRKRFIQGANGSIPLSYTPTKPGQGGDTVPAMLSPGEYVVNNRAMALPGAQPLLQALNAAGNGGRYAEGGQVMDPQQLIRLLTMIAQFAVGGDAQGDGDSGESAACQDCGQPGHMNCGGGVPQHFAWGGMARPQMGGFQRGGGMGPGAPRTPSTGSGMGSMPRQPAQPVGGPSGAPSRFGTGFTGTGWSTTGTMPSPSVGGTSFGPGFGGSGDTTGANGFQQSLYDLLNQYGATGMFSPGGDPRMMAAVQSQATSNADAMRARQQNSLALGGMDAGQAAAYKQMADLRGQGDVANALNQAQLGQLQAQQDFGRNLFGQVSGFNTDAWKAWNDYMHAQGLK